MGVDEAHEYVFGYVLMNDWSARDIQQWEYVPLGPFNAKNFGTTISPWVVLTDALEPFHARGLPNEVALTDYLREERTENIVDIHLEVSISSKPAYKFCENESFVRISLTRVAATGNTTTITRTSSKNLVWSWPQMIAHHSISGCNLRAGDLLGSGTISGVDAGSQGSMLEQTQGGKMAMALEGGENRTFLQDGDTVVIQGWAGAGDGLIGFGECSGKILAARHV